MDRWMDGQMDKWTDDKTNKSKSKLQNLGDEYIFHLFANFHSKIVGKNKQIIILVTVLYLGNATCYLFLTLPLRGV